MKEEIKKLYEAGLTIRQIQKKLGISSPSVVHYHVKRLYLNKNDLKRISINKFLSIIPGKRYPVSHIGKADEESNLITAGYNAYRKDLLDTIEELRIK